MDLESAFRTSPSTRPGAGEPPVPDRLLSELEKRFRRRHEASSRPMTWLAVTVLAAALPWSVGLVAGYCWWATRAAFWVLGR